VFGSHDEIAARVAEHKGLVKPTSLPQPQTVLGDADGLDDFDLNLTGEGEDRLWSAQEPDLPPLPTKLSPSQAARLAEIFDFLHRGLTSAADNIVANDDGTQVVITYPEWQTIQAVHMLLGRYLRAVAEPDALVE
jgi:hypothetical protein